MCVGFDNIVKVQWLSAEKSDGERGFPFDHNVNEMHGTVSPMNSALVEFEVRYSVHIKCVHDRAPKGPSFYSSDFRAWITWASVNHPCFMA
jgi:hypothetical protein